ncbi:hypothetical protein DL766_008679 [Monosporascus sp. MC13-8B]|nr:hypothetical protein DL763_005643 [Monosporascus cannonballus]RYP18408.1 hypothetical protein DL766_008679 [Monosporascus sp. MC13-8B]
MLQLGARAVRRVGTSYICATCLGASNLTPISAPQRVASTARHHDPSFSTTARQASSPAENQPTPAADVTEASTTAQLSLPPSKSPPPKKKKKSKKPAKKQIDAQSDAERQLSVLQGALEALKNVLAAQNIDVGNIITGKEAGDDKKKQVAQQPKSKAKGAKSRTEDAPSTAQEGESAEQDAEQKVTSAESRPDPGSSDINALGKALANVNASAASSKTDKMTVKAKPATKKAGKRVKQRKASGVAKKTKGKKQTSQAPEGADASISTPSDSLGKSSPTKAPYRAIGKPFSGDSPGHPEGASKEKPPKRSKSKKGKVPLTISKVNSNTLTLAPIDAPRAPVPSLSYGLERVLFNPGVYYLQDPRSRVYNFDPYLSNIMPIQEFDFNALKQYVTSSKDSTLISIAKEYGKKYTGSTSSMSSMLSHFHYLLSAWRNVNVEMLSRSIKPDSLQFTRINRAPAAIFLHWKDGTYAIDADKEFDTANILSMLGKSMEKLLTLPKEEYERYRHSNSDQITQEERDAEEAYHYTGFRDFLMRSQLDAHDPRVPGSGMFDLKTRAVISIRMDAKGFEKGLGYEIRNRFGDWESFEREYYDMIRSAFMKYSLQVRMGRMDGIFVAFHNTQRIFGFQYIPLSEMDLALHGTSNVTLGNREFKLSLRLLNELLDRATKKWPEQSLRLHFETRTSVASPFMYIFAKPVKPEDIDEVQNANKASIEAFERTIMGLNKEAGEAEPEPENDDVIEEEEDEDNESPKTEEMQTLAAWEEVRQTVEDAMEDDEVGVGIVREAIEDALEQSGLIRAKSSEEARGYVDALLTAITGAQHPKLTVSSDSLPKAAPTEDSEEPADGGATASAVQTASATETESSNDSQTSVDDETSSTAQVREREASEESSATVDQTPESTSHESIASIGDQETPKVVSADSELPSSVDDTVSQDQTPASNPEESEAVARNEESAVEEEEDDPDEDEEVSELEGDVVSPSDMSPLKDLIVRMAQRIDEKPVPEENINETMNDSSKLKAFERILGKMISLAKVDESEQHLTTSSPGASAAETQYSEPAEPATTTTEADDTLSSAEDAEKIDSHELPAEEAEQGEILGMVLTIKNKINGQYVTRPENLSKYDEWVLEYNIEELPDERARRFYAQCKTRRRKALVDERDKDSEWYALFQGQLQKRTQKGREWRARELERSQNKPVHIVGQDGPLEWEDVFGNTVVAKAPPQKLTLDPEDLDSEVEELDFVGEPEETEVPSKEAGEGEPEETDVPSKEAEEDENSDQTKV